MENFEVIIEELKNLEEDGVPRNIKKLINDVIFCLNDEAIEVSTRVSKALSIIDEITNDINLSSHTRTQFWNITSLLEGM